MSDDLFVKIINREVPADIVFENDRVLAFRDIDPQAPTHILIIPKRRIPTINDLEDGDAELMGQLLLAARDIARAEGLSEDGYRLVFNCNRHGCQSVFHIHLYLLGGRQLDWPPG
ncbi:MAG: histidine triad nucleotide-binding protein [Wenzhouxiangella sp.]